MEPRAIAKAPEGEGCPRCGGFVYAAEQMLARGRVSVKLLPLNLIFYRKKKKNSFRKKLFEFKIPAILIFK